MHLYLDSNVFISAVESDSDLGAMARLIFRRIDQGELSAITSELTLAEVLPRPVAEDNEFLINAHMRMLVSRRGFEVRAVDRDVLIESATAVLNGCTEIVTEDRRLKAPAELRMLRLDDEALK